MTHYRTDDVRIEQGDELLAPMQVMRELAATDRSEQTTFEGRRAVHDILRGADDRLMVVVGNALTFFRFHRATITWDRTPERVRFSASSEDPGGGIEAE